MHPRNSGVGSGSHALRPGVRNVVPVPRFCCNRGNSIYPPGSVPTWIGGRDPVTGDPFTRLKSTSNIILDPVPASW